jgi:LmbE family N-acetylglucosaminyl deacetylase
MESPDDAELAEMTTQFDTDLPRRLMGIWAHPDDEAYLSAGLMGRVLDAGGSVTVLTATRGEKGTADPADYDQAHFAARRERELRASLRELGVHDVRLLGYPDGECDRVNDESAIDRIAAAIAASAPDLVVTFGPDGLTGHRDHRVVSAWVSEAWRRVGTAELLYATIPADSVIDVDHDDRKSLCAPPASTPADGVPAEQIALVCELSELELERKRRALARHTSQTREVAAALGEDTFRRSWRTEWFRRPSEEELSTCGLCATTASQARTHRPEWTSSSSWRTRTSVCPRLV